MPSWNRGLKACSPITTEKISKGYTATDHADYASSDSRKQPWISVRGSVRSSLAKEVGSSHYPSRPVYDPFTFTGGPLLRLLRLNRERAHRVEALAVAMHVGGKCFEAVG